jgi:hypothetical protein
MSDRSFDYFQEGRDTSYGYGDSHARGQEAELSFESCAGKHPIPCFCVHPPLAVNARPKSTAAKLSAIWWADVRMMWP